MFIDFDDLIADLYSRTIELVFVEYVSRCRLPAIFSDNAFAIQRFDEYAELFQAVVGAHAHT
jgi:hypothetical protein